MTAPRYPIYVPSKGRSTNAQALTIRFLMLDKVPFRVVVEEDEHDAYAAVVGEERILVLPESGGGLIYARNWIKAHAIAEGHERHWQLDDNMRHVRRMWKNTRVPCNSGPALRCVEDFSDRYENVAISGLAYEMFVVPYQRIPPFYLNQHVYSCTLVNNQIPHQWRLRHNDDTDMCLQVLADGWCTVLINAFMVSKVRTMKIAGGNTDDLYQGDGRLKMARSLERVWPGTVRTDRRYGRPQHVIAKAWQQFDTPLKLKPGIDLAALAGTREEYGLDLKQVRPTIKSDRLQREFDKRQEADEG